MIFGFYEDGTRYFSQRSGLVRRLNYDRGLNGQWLFVVWKGKLLYITLDVGLCLILMY